MSPRMTIFQAWILPLFAILSIMLSATVRAESFYVDKSHASASDSNPGTESAPWLTIQHAADAVKNPGDIVFIKEGTYPECIELNKHSGTSGSYITFASYPGDSVTIDSSSWAGLVVTGVSWIKIVGIKQKNAGSHGIYISNADNIWVEDCEFSFNGWAGVMIKGERGDVSSCTIRNCRAYNNEHEGIYLGTASSVHRIHDILVENCVAYDNNDEGIQNTGDENPGPHNNIFRNNEVYNNGPGSWAAMDLAGDGLVVEGNSVHHNTNPMSGIYLDGADGIIRNNIVYNNNGADAYDSGIRLYSCGGTIQVYNNTIHGHGGHGISSSNSSGIMVKNNIISQVDERQITGSGITCDYNLRFGGSVEKTGSHDQTGDPEFVSTLEGSEDFHIKSGSCAIDNGIDVGLPFTGSAPDIGAYEYVDLSPPKGIKVLVR